MPMLSDYSNHDPGDDPYNSDEYLSSETSFYRTTNSDFSQTGFTSTHSQLNTFINEVPMDWNLFQSDLTPGNLFNLETDFVGSFIDNDSTPDYSAVATNTSFVELEPPGLTNGTSEVKTEHCIPDRLSNNTIEIEMPHELEGDCDVSRDYRAGAANYSVNDLISTTEATEANGFTFLEGCHAVQKFKIKVQNGLRARPIIKSIVDLDEIVELMLTFGENNVSISEQQVKNEAVEKFVVKNLEKKRSAVSCRSYVHGIALAMKWKELEEEQMGGEADRKKINNKFTNFVRPSRHAGDKLELELLKKYQLTKSSSYKEIELNCNISLVIFNDNGVITYNSHSMCKGNIFFFLETETNMFWIKNIRGFCRNH